jgi:hypothetical protein
MVKEINLATIIFLLFDTDVKLLYLLPLCKLPKRNGVLLAISVKKTFDNEFMQHTVIFFAQITFEAPVKGTEFSSWKRMNQQNFQCSRIKYFTILTTIFAHTKYDAYEVACGICELR